MPKEGNYLVPHNPSVPICSLGRNPSINVNAEPMLKVLSNGHLRRIDVRPFIATIEQAIKLCLRFTLGALERDVTGQAFPAQRITTEVKLQFPTALALRADMSLALVSHFFVSCFCFS